MGCFTGRKSRKRGAAVHAKARTSSSSSISISMSVESEAQEESRSAGGGGSSFKSKSKNAQRFINGNPKLSCSSHPGCGRSGVHASSSSPSFFNLLGRRTRSMAGMEVQSHTLATTKTPCPMSLPSPQRPSSKPSAYRLPRPHEPPPPPPLSSDNHNYIRRSTSVHNGNSSSSSSSSTNALPRAGVPSYVPQPLPRPPREALAGLRAFTYDELVTACNSFSPDRCVGDADTQLATYEGILRVSDSNPEKQPEITIVRRLCTSWEQSCKAWYAELEALARLHDHHHLCKILGYHAEEEGTERFVVYQRLAKGSLDRLLYEKDDSPPLDWPSRMKIAMGAAQDLAFLHEREPEPITYGEFRASHIHVEMDHSAKLSGYGFSSWNTESTCACHAKVTEANASPDQSWSRQQGSPKRSSDVCSFGVVLLELLTGRKNMDLQAPKEERNLVRWTRPFLRDQDRLFLIMDPKLQGKFPARGAKMVGELARRCLQKDFSQRPTMREVLEVVKMVQSMRYPSRFPSRDLSTSFMVAAAGSGGGGRRSISEFNSSSSAASMEMKVVTKFDVIENPPLKPLIIPSRSSCSCTFAMEEEERTRQDKTASALVVCPRQARELLAIASHFDLLDSFS